MRRPKTYFFYSVKQLLLIGFIPQRGKVVLNNELLMSNEDGCTFENKRMMNCAEEHLGFINRAAAVRDRIIYCNH